MTKHATAATAHAEAPPGVAPSAQQMDLPDPLDLASVDACRDALQCWLEGQDTTTARTLRLPDADNLLALQLAVAALCSAQTAGVALRVTTLDGAAIPALDPALTQEPAA